MAGGTGSRLWPLSREMYPKQFLRLASDLTMLQATVARLKNLSCDDPLVICNEEHRFIVAEQLRQLDKLDGKIILEPIGRNTAPAVALAAITALKNFNKDSGEPEPLLLVLAADHIIEDNDAFIQSIESAIPYARNDKLVTFGIVATAPETGYGYIKRGQYIDNTRNAFIVEKFVEKPNLDIANEYIASGEYYWNSGMFMFKASRYLKELEKFRPDIYECCIKSIEINDPAFNFVHIDRKIFTSCPSDSIDYAVMEHTDDAVVVPMNAGWNDVGSWSSLWEIDDKDASGNVHRGDVVFHNSGGNYIYAETGLVAAIGVKDLVVVQTKDAVLITTKESSQDVKKIVEKLRSEGRSEYYIHREVYRPWGKYDSIDKGERYLVKRITLNPGQKLSEQMHYHRSEHWIVVSGTAKVTKDNAIQFVSENQSIYIPQGTKHALENPGKISLELIEIQSGSYLNEDDIVRFNEEYDFY